MFHLERQWRVDGVNGRGDKGINLPLNASLKIGNAINAQVLLNPTYNDCVGKVSVRDEGRY